MRKTLLSLFITSTCLFQSCQHVSNDIEPTLSYSIQDKYLLSLPSPFPPLTEEEKAQDWGKEVQIGFGFAHELDLYQAITAFKRAEFLIPQTNKPRTMEIQYEILLCYYMGKKYSDVVYTFEHSQLRYATQEFPAYHDLMLILHEAYQHEGLHNQEERMFQAIQYTYPFDAEKLTLSTALTHANFAQIKAIAANPPPKPYLDNLLSEYQARKKSVGTAQGLNALLPGAGYFYLGQIQSGTTAFFLNGLFIAASAYFFCDGNIAAGLIFTSFEAGWYFGGIFGAGLEAKAYNERLYESLATPMMNRERLFPALMLNYAF